MSRRGTAKTRISASRVQQYKAHRVWLTLSKRMSVLLGLTFFGSSIALASTQVETTKPLILQSSEVMLHELPPLVNATIVSPEAEFLSNVSSPVTGQNTQVSIGKALLNQLTPVADETTAPRPAEFLSQVSPQTIRQGTKISLN